MMMDVNRLISYTLRAGVIASGLLALVGLVSWALNGFSNLPEIQGRDIGDKILAGLAGDPSGLVYCAVAVLIATPVLRVALSTLYFAFEGDKKYVLITFSVLAMLLFALFSGVSG
jgi:uncharacterized protein